MKIVVALESPYHDKIGDFLSNHGHEVYRAEDRDAAELIWTWSDEVTEGSANLLITGSDPQWDSVKELALTDLPEEHIYIVANLFESSIDWTGEMILEYIEENLLSNAK